MSIKYRLAPDIREVAEDIVDKLDWDHIRMEHVGFVRGIDAGSEVIAKEFDYLTSKGKIKTIIHELMHIPKSFGGGFINHNKINSYSVNQAYQRYRNLMEKEEG